MAYMLGVMFVMVVTIEPPIPRSGAYHSVRIY